MEKLQGLIIHEKYVDIGAYITGKHKILIISSISATCFSPHIPSSGTKNT
jgi:hypothetical protein